MYSPGFLPVISFESPMLQPEVGKNIRRLEESNALPSKLGACEISDNFNFDDYDSALNFKTNLPLIDPCMPRVIDNLQASTLKLTSPSIQYKDPYSSSPDINQSIYLTLS
jgi:hypothetical protein